MKNPTTEKRIVNLIINIIAPVVKKRKCNIKEVISPKNVAGLIFLQQKGVQFHNIKRMTRDIIENKISLGQAIIKEFGDMK